MGDLLRLCFSQYAEFRARQELAANAVSLTVALLFWRWWEPDVKNLCSFIST